VKLLPSRRALVGILGVDVVMAVHLASRKLAEFS
jgi:hypothetical protein